MRLRAKRRAHAWMAAGALALVALHAGALLAISTALGWSLAAVIAVAALMLLIHGIRRHR